MTDIGLSNLQTIGGFDIYNNSALTSLTGLGNLTSVGDLWIFDNPELIDLGNLSSLTTIQYKLDLFNNKIK